jgi:hypothetical protein
MNPRLRVGAPTSVRDTPGRRRILGPAPHEEGAVVSFRFNAPPGWPTPPEGWIPPPGWRPNPAWTPAPAGWQFYVEETPSYLDEVPPRRAQADTLLRPPGSDLRQRRQSWQAWAGRHKVLIGAGAAVLVLVGATAYGSNGSGPSTVTTVAASSSAPTTTQPTTAPAVDSAAVTTTRPTAAATSVPSAKDVVPSKIPATSTTRRPVVTRTTTAAAIPKSSVPRASGAWCGAPPNPFGYTFCSGGQITDPAPDACSYFPCIASFWEGQGFMVQCQDGMFGLSGGRRGACSYHHGVRRPVYRRG